MNSDFTRLEELLVLSMMTAGQNLPVTSIPVSINAAAFPGTGELVPLYRNTYDRVIALRVRWVNPGGALFTQLSIQARPTGIIDTLDASISRLTSDTIWLTPLQTLYIGYIPADGPPTGTFNVLLFDPLMALSK